MTSSPRQNAPTRAPGTRAVPGRAVTATSPSIAALVSAESRRSYSSRISFSALAPASPPTTDRWPSERCETSRQNPASRSGTRWVVVGAVRQATLATAATPSTSFSRGRPPPKGSSPGRSRLVQSASMESTASAGLSASKPGSCGARNTSLPVSGAAETRRAV